MHRERPGRGGAREAVAAPRAALHPRFSPEPSPWPEPEDQTLAGAWRLREERRDPHSDTGGFRPQTETPVSSVQTVPRLPPPPLIGTCGGAAMISFTACGMSVPSEGNKAS